MSLKLILSLPVYSVEKLLRICYNYFMGWFNYYGLAVMAVIMIPNIIYAATHKSDADTVYKNKAVIIAEQIG
ncbi:MAG: hypothetical protein K2G96_00515, partial [Clostridia bacterium]|nr:hypothetical protein [Clostridia bacterium]